MRSASASLSILHDFEKDFIVKKIRNFSDELFLADSLHDCYVVNILITGLYTKEDGLWTTNVFHAVIS